MVHFRGQIKLASGALLVVSADVIPGKEAEFNKWYDESHIPQFFANLPMVRSIRRFHSKRSNPQFLTIYEFDSMDDLKKFLSSDEAKSAGADADKQIGALAKSFSYNSYSQIYPAQQK
jgi:antibiotic biosynthesis monooxygenase (ABM) superfamily enzyme